MFGCDRELNTQFKSTCNVSLWYQVPVFDKNQNPGRLITFWAANNEIISSYNFLSWGGGGGVKSG